MILDILRSFFRLPLWVQLWVVVLLVPVNVASLALIGQPWGVLVAVMAIGAMLLNLLVMVHDRGFSKLMALPHLLVWTPLVPLLLWLLLSGAAQPGWPRVLMAVILVTDLVSLAFDYPDFLRWWRGERAAV